MLGSHPLRLRETLLLIALWPVAMMLVAAAAITNVPPFFPLGRLIAQGCVHLAPWYAGVSGPLVLIVPWLANRTRVGAALYAMLVSLAVPLLTTLILLPTFYVGILSFGFIFETRALPSLLWASMTIGWLFSSARKNGMARAARG